MRLALWLAALFGTAVACALFVGNNQGTVTLYWPDYRVDMSLNFALLVIALVFVLLHGALRALAGLFSIPHKARRWRLSYKERAIYAGVLDAIAHLFAGRFVRARKAAQAVVAIEDAMQASEEALPDAARLRTLAHLLAAESAHALQDRNTREQHYQVALAEARSKQASDLHDGVQLRAARWALDDRDAPAALQSLEQLPQGTARRTIALRLRFKAARQVRNHRQALEAARLLTKHRAFSELAGSGIVRGLALELLRSAHDSAQLTQAWGVLDANERRLPDVALEAAERWLDAAGDAAVARDWLLPLWDQLSAAPALGAFADVSRRPGTPFAPTDLTAAHRVRLVGVLERSFAATAPQPDAPEAVPPFAAEAQWLARIEATQRAQPGDPLLQYLAGALCVRLSLWGKAHALLRQALPLLKDPEIQRRAWLSMAELAEQRQDAHAAAQAWRAAALVERERHLLKTVNL